MLLGGLYGLMALGMALVWGVLNIVNLAHGALIMLGGYCVYFLFVGAHIDPFAALPIAMAVMFCVGYALQRFILNLIIRSAALNTLLITFGLDVVLTYLAQLAFSADFRAINPSYAGANVTVAGVTIPLVRLAVFMVALLLATALWVLLERTRLGRAIRATAQNLTAARLYGVDPARLYAVTFGLGAALAGAAGGLYGMVSQVTPYIGDDADRQILRHRDHGRAGQPVRHHPGRPRHRHRRGLGRDLYRRDLHRCDQLRVVGAHPDRAAGAQLAGA